MSIKVQKKLSLSRLFNPKSSFMEYKLAFFSRHQLEIPQRSFYSKLLLKALKEFASEEPNLEIIFILILFIVNIGTNFFNSVSIDLFHQFVHCVAVVDFLDPRQQIISALFLLTSGIIISQENIENDIEFFSAVLYKCLMIMNQNHTSEFLEIHSFSLLFKLLTVNPVLVNFFRFNLEITYDVIQQFSLGQFFKYSFLEEFVYESNIFSNMPEEIFLSTVKFHLIFQESPRVAQLILHNLNYISVEAIEVATHLLICRQFAISDQIMYLPNSLFICSLNNPRLLLASLKYLNLKYDSYKVEPSPDDDNLINILVEIILCEEVEYIFKKKAFQLLNKIISNNNIDYNENLFLAFEMFSDMFEEEEYSDEEEEGFDNQLMHCGDSE